PGRRQAAGHARRAGLRPARVAARDRDACPGRPLHRPAGRRALRAGDLLQPPRRHDGRNRGPLGGPEALRRAAPRPRVPPLARQHGPVHGQHPRHRARPGDGPRRAPHARLPRQVGRALPDPAALDGPGGPRAHRLAVDARLGVQPHRLAAARGGPAGVAGCAARRPAEPLLARQPRAREGLDRAGQRVAPPSARHGHRARRPELDTQGRDRADARRPRRLLPAPLRHHAADALAHPARRDPVHLRLHVLRHDRDLHPHARRAREHDADPREPRLLHRHPRREPRQGRGDRAVPAARARRGERRAAEADPPQRGDLMTTFTATLPPAPARGRGVGRVASRTVFYLTVAIFTLFAALPFYVMLITAFKRNPNIFDPEASPFWYSQSPTFDHVRLLFTDTLFVRWLLNSFMVGGLVVLITLLLAVPAAYSLARLAGSWGEVLGIGIFLTYLV